MTDGSHSPWLRRRFRGWGSDGRRVPAGKAGKQCPHCPAFENAVKSCIRCFTTLRGMGTFFTSSIASGTIHQLIEFTTTIVCQILAGPVGVMIAAGIRRGRVIIECIIHPFIQIVETIWVIVFYIGKVKEYSVKGIAVVTDLPVC